MAVELQLPAWLAPDDVLEALTAIALDRADRRTQADLERRLSDAAQR